MVARVTAKLVGDQKPTFVPYPKAYDPAGKTYRSGKLGQLHSRAASGR